MSLRLWFLALGLAVPLAGLSAMVAAAILAIIVLSSGCLPSRTITTAPSLSRDALLALLVRADAARQQAFETGDPTPLRGLFADAAIAPLLPRLARLHKLGERLEERDSSTTLVHWVAGDGTAEGAMEVEGRQRTVSGSAGDPPWTRVPRQWFAALHWSGGRWLVVNARDLPPPQWWRP